MIECLEALNRDGYISQDDLVVARNAESTGSESATLGYEVEILGSARDNLGLGFRVDPYTSAGPVFRSYGYNVSTDGLIEGASPAAKHPASLNLATKGLAKVGVIPEIARGVVTSHVSFGHPDHDLDYEDELFSGLTDILRIAEMDGGTTPKRLISPLNYARSGNVAIVNGWNQAGYLGVSLENSDFFACKNWNSPAARIEYRTLRYKNPEQHGRALSVLYFMSRSFLDDESSVSKRRLTEFHDWYSEYRVHNLLPGLEDIALPVVRMDDLIPFCSYIRPYVKHMAEADTTGLKNRVTDLIVDLQEEYGMNVTKLEV